MQDGLGRERRCRDGFQGVHRKRLAENTELTQEDDLGPRPDSHRAWGWRAGESQDGGFLDTLSSFPQCSGPGGIAVMPAAYLPSGKPSGLVSVFRLIQNDPRGWPAVLTSVCKVWLRGVLLLAAGNRRSGWKQNTSDCMSLSY